MSVYLDQKAGSPLYFEAAQAAVFSLAEAGAAANIPAIAGLGKATTQPAKLEMEYRRHHLSRPRDALEQGLQAITGILVSGQLTAGFRGITRNITGTGKQAGSSYPPGRGIERQTWQLS